VNNTPLLPNQNIRVTLEQPDTVQMSRAEVKRIHDLALAVAQMCRGILGWDLLPTGATQTKARERANR